MSRDHPCRQMYSNFLSHGSILGQERVATKIPQIRKRNSFQSLEDAETVWKIQVPM